VAWQLERFKDCSVLHGKDIILTPDKLTPPLTEGYAFLLKSSIFFTAIQFL